MSLISHLSGTKYIAAIGDSKSASPDTSWQFPLITKLEGHTKQNWLTCLTHANAGWTTANAQSGLAAALAAVSLVPDLVFVDIGVNDFAALPAQATLEANYASILDQLHAKWPSALIIVAKPWKSGQNTNANTFATYMGNVLATRAWAVVGTDEQAWLGSWNSDGTHPTTAGYNEMARRWFLAAYP